MPAANYMTIDDTQSIWSTTLDATRFGNIGVRMAEILNFKVYHDATNQCTNDAVTPLFEQISEECLMDLIMAAKGTDTVEPWEFIQANVSSFLLRKLQEWRKEIKEIQEIESKRHRIKFPSIKSSFPSHSTEG
jgi:hypothetical protein